MDVKEQIKEFILTDLCEDLDVDQIEDDQNLFDSGILDSLGILKILSFLDEELDIDISSDEIKPENFATLNKICLLINV